MSNIEHQNQPIKSKKNRKKTIRSLKLLSLITVGLLILVGSLYFYTSNKSLTLNKNPNLQPYSEPKGGRSSSVTNYYNQAVKAWKAGDKNQAKQFAKKGLEENDKLTPKQQAEIKDQANKVYTLYDLSNGSYNGQ